MFHLDQTVHKHWRARLVVCGTMLVLAIIGIIIMNVHSQTYWVYSQVMALLYALLSLWLYWYLHRGQSREQLRTTFWHQLLHWFALLMSIYLIAVFVHTGILAANQAGLVTLTLLALTIFTAGLYVDISFVVIGVMLGIFAIAAALIETYLSVFMIPVVLIVAGVIYFITHRQKRQSMAQQKQ